VRAPKPSSIDPRIGKTLDTIVLHALEPLREERYASVAALSNDVRRYLAGEPITTAPPSAWLLFRRLVVQNKVAAAFVATVFLGVLAFGVQRQVLLDEAVRQKSAAEYRAQRLSALLAFVPDCVHVSNREQLSAYIAKPGTVLDESVSFSSPNPHYDPHGGEVPTESLDPQD
jgi:hypothetical protein